ncbi:MAG TPA: hypothetical protein VFV27_00370 [Nevskiaceae bacterium]|nr:hypothetical protein [Nevskiaceae bacterium]
MWKPLAVIVGLSAGGGPVGLAAAPPAGGPSALEQRECAYFARSYERLAGLRDAGATRAHAVTSETRYLERDGRTGSHLPARSFRASVERFAEQVYRLDTLSPLQLRAYGMAQCLLAKTVTDEAQWIQQVEALDARALSCEAQPDRFGHCLAGSAP